MKNYFIHQKCILFSKMSLQSIPFLTSHTTLHILMVTMHAKNVFKKQKTEGGSAKTVPIITMNTAALTKAVKKQQTEDVKVIG